MAQDIKEICAIFFDYRKASIDLLTTVADPGREAGAPPESNHVRVRKVASCYLPSQPASYAALPP